MDPEPVRDRHPSAAVGLASGLRRAWSAGYGVRDLRADLLSGLVVGVVALPLSMALAIASGVPPEHGLYTAIVAGALTAVLGGSRVQVTGPTAAFVVLLAPVSARHGVQGLVLASAMAGVVLVAMGVFKLGRLVRFVPYPVTTGFTAGIGVVIATLQVQGFLGLRAADAPSEAGWIERVADIAQALPSFTPADLGVGLATLATLLAWRRLRTALPAPLVGLLVGALVAAALEAWLPGADVATLRERFGGPGRPDGVPRSLPGFALPWNLPGAGGGAAAPLDLALLRALLPSALAIAMLGAIESLLSALVADGLSGDRHDPDAELVALGIGNLASSAFGGFAATGAIARTATNVRSGARSPVAAVVHAGFVLAVLLSLAPLLGRLPMASLAALLLVVAWDMSELRHVAQTVRTAPRSDVLVLLTCLTLTVLTDMTVAVAVGVALASLLFMRRMAEIGGARLLADRHPEHDVPLPPGVIVYDIAGPLFFGAAHKATGPLIDLNTGGLRAVLLDLEDVPAIDATGIVNLRSATQRLLKGGVQVSLIGLAPQPAQALERAGLLGPGGLARHPSLGAALAALEDLPATGH